MSGTGTAYEAWIVKQQPVFSRLPVVFQENTVTEALIAFWDEFLLETKGNLDDFENQINPLTCEEKWLDFLAPLFGFTDEYWDTRWKAESKRLLMSRAYDFIWQNKGSGEVLSYVLNSLEIRNEIVVNGSFIIGTDKVSEPLGNIYWNYTIYLPPAYEGTEKVELTKRIDRIYGPLWCNRNIAFDAARFQTFRMMGKDNSTLVTTEQAKVIQLDGE